MYRKKSKGKIDAEYEIFYEPLGVGEYSPR